jgi:hypothetical protein
MTKPYSSPIRKPMTEAEVDAAMMVYGGLMGEAKYRLNWIRYGLTNRTGLPMPMVREYCFLQLRMICELIALGCLVIHGDIEATKTKKFKTYAADDILNNLERLNPTFYPIPYLLDSGSTEDRQIMVGIKEEFLKKEQLLSLYRKICGPALHRGRLDDLLAKQKASDFPQISKHLVLTMNLLRRHYTLFSQNSMAVICDFGHMDAGGVNVILTSV